MNNVKLLFIIVATLLVTACSDDETFTTNSSARLEFSTDTVSFDTIFCGISSPTERLIVYNRNTKAIRLKSVALLRATHSAFRMNVDGQYGKCISDVEIGANDSIFIFLETTVEENLDALTTDSILFTLESGTTQAVALEAFGLKAATLRNERITSNTTLTSEQPYIVYDSLVVATDACLTLAAGTTLYFHKDASLIVHGALKIEGEADNEVTLRGDRLDKLLPYLPYDRTDGQWGGVMLTNTCTGCDVRFADIHGGTFGIACDSIQGTMTLQNSTIHNVVGDAIHVNNSAVLIANCQLSNALGYCVNLINVKADVYHCTIVQFYPWSSGRGYAVLVQRYADELTDWDETECNFYNCFITGYANDEVYAEFNAEQTDLRAHFYSCVANTDITDEKYFTNCIAESNKNEAYKDTNFKLVDTHNFVYDFRLDEKSIAIGTANPQYTILYPTDRTGLSHSTDKPNAGCFSK